jgi:hypothetical protein
MLGADEDVAIIFDSDSPTAAQPADSQTAAGAAVGGAGADAAAGVGAGAEPTAKRIQLAELHAPAAAAADAAAAAAERLARVAASSACPEPLTGLQEDIEFALAQGDGLPWEDLRDRLEHILQAGFHGNTDFDRSRVMTGLSEGERVMGWPDWQPSSGCPRLGVMPSDAAEQCRSLDRTPVPG